MHFRSVWYCSESVSPSSKGKKKYDYLGQSESKLVRKNSKKLRKLFHHSFILKLKKKQKNNVLNALLTYAVVGELNNLKGILVNF